MSPWTVIPPADLTEEHQYYELMHPAVGILELGVSSFFRWQSRQTGLAGYPGYLSGEPGYRTSVGLYVQWQRKEHAIEMRIERARAQWEAKRQERAAGKNRPSQPD